MKHNEKFNNFLSLAENELQLSKICNVMENYDMRDTLFRR